jgi:hypothetical protein
LGNFIKRFQIQNPAKQIGIQIRIQISKTGKIEKKSKTEKSEESSPGQSLSSRPTRSPARHTKMICTRQAGPTRKTSSSSSDLEKQLVVDCAPVDRVKMRATAPGAYKAWSHTVKNPKRPPSSSISSHIALSSPLYQENPPEFITDPSIAATPGSDDGPRRSVVSCRSFWSKNRPWGLSINGSTPLPFLRHHRNIHNSV